MKEEEVLKNLTPDELKKFEKKLSEVIDEHIKRRKLQFGIEKAHREAVNFCAYPFTKGYVKESTGYMLNRPDPLFELGVKNFDLLLFHSRRRCIFVEIKSTIADIRELKNIQERIKVVEENLGSINKYCGEVILPENIEYVIAIDTSDSVKVWEWITKLDLKLIVWFINKTSGKLTLAHFDQSQVGALRDKGRIHRDNNLLGLLCKKEINSSVKEFDFFPTSQLFDKTVKCLLKSRAAEDSKKIDLDKMRAVVDRNYFFIDDSDVEG